MAKAKVLKTTVEMDQELREPVMLYVMKRKLQDGSYSLKQFYNEAVKDKLEKDKEA